MKREEPLPESPNLDSLAVEHPRRKLTLVRLLWPKIRACLARGHTVREIQEKLRLDGIQINYKNLCACLAELRQRDGGNSSQETAAAMAGKRGPDPVPGRRRGDDIGRGQQDPLENVRRLTEKRRPGFQYPGTLPDKELFGE